MGSTHRPTKFGLLDNREGAAIVEFLGWEHGGVKAPPVPEIVLLHIRKSSGSTFAHIAAQNKRQSNIEVADFCDKTVRVD